MASPRVINPQVQVPVTRQQRITRSPSSPHTLQLSPWWLQPFCLFPVLPGETMTQCYLQQQFWTDPIKSKWKNNPWSAEWFFFYVKFRDLPGWEASADGLGRDLIQMIEVGEDLSPNQNAAGNAWTYCPPGGIDYTLEALKRVVEVYFREEGQAWNAGVNASGVPLSHVFAGGRRDVMERLTISATAEDRRIAMPAFVGGLAYQAMMDYSANRNQSTAELMAMDYEDIVRSAGGRAVARDVDRDDLHIPELLGLIRHHDYPNNTVEPSTGAPSVAFGTRIKQAVKANFRFPEFGWVLGVMTIRPKVLYGRQEGLYADMMQLRTDWFMASDDPNADTHWKTIADNTGPLKGIMDTPNTPYTIDLRNLMWHGEQFSNYALTATEDGAVVLPAASGQRDYVAQTDIDAIWATAGGVIKANGVVDITVKTYPALNPYSTQDDRQWSNRD